MQYIACRNIERKRIAKFNSRKMLFEFTVIETKTSCRITGLKYSDKITRIKLSNPKQQGFDDVQYCATNLQLSY